MGRSELTHTTDWARQRETLSAYLDGETPDEERAALTAHIAGCDRCQDELAQLTATRALLRAQPTAAPPRTFTLPLDGPLPQPSVRQGAALSMVGRRRGWSRRVQWLGGAVAAAGLLLALSGALPGATTHSVASSMAGRQQNASGVRGMRSPAEAASPAGGQPGTPSVAATPTDTTTVAANSPTASGTQGNGDGADTGPAIPAVTLAGAGVVVVGLGMVAAGGATRRRRRDDGKRSGG